MNQNLRYEIIDLNHDQGKRSNNKFWGIKDFMMPELSLASNSSSSESSETGSSRKRKHLSENFLELKKNPVVHQAGIDLQLGKDHHRLPLDWEQCLDLQSGKMYFLNRKTSRKSWNLPIKSDLRPDLELNISSSATTAGVSSPPLKPAENATGGFRGPNEEQEHFSSSNSSNNMVAMACLNCHLLVILSKSSPSCPNCKYVHSLLPPSQPNPSPKSTTPSAFKPLDTLTLFS